MNAIYVTKAEALAQKQELQRELNSGIKGTATLTSTPTPYVGNYLFEKYNVYDAGTYTNFKDISLSPIVVTSEDLLVNFVFIEVTNGVAKKVLQGMPTVNYDTINDFVETEIEKIAKFNTAENLMVFVDENDKAFGVVDENGDWDIYLNEQRKAEINPVKKINTAEDYLFGIMDLNNKFIPILDKNGKVVTDSNSSNSTEFLSGEFPVNKEKGILDVASFNAIKYNLTIPSVAVGRETAKGANDAPKIPLTDGGYTHPSIVHVASGWNGWNYWLAITPTFGIIEQQAGPNNKPASFENPHILVSNNGIDWQEPVGISNPLDTPDAEDVIGSQNSYWSDTHLVLGNDSYLHLYYRGNVISASKLNQPSGSFMRSVVHRKSKDGVNWSDAELIYSTNTEGVDVNSGLMSPAFINDKSHWEVYDVVTKTVTNTYESTQNTNRAVMRRFGTSPKNFENYSNDGVVNFDSRPWGVGMSVWHLDACKIGNTYFLLLNCGTNDQAIADKLYLAYSGDGWNFNVIPTALFNSVTYRSCMIPKTSKDGKLCFWIYQSERLQGNVNLYELKLDYK